RNFQAQLRRQELIGYHIRVKIELAGIFAGTLRNFLLNTSKTNRRITAGSGNVSHIGEFGIYAGGSSPAGSFIKIGNAHFVYPDTHTLLGAIVTRVQNPDHNA